MRAEIQTVVSEIENSLELLRQRMGWETARHRLEEFNARVEDPNLWDDPAKAQKLMRDRQSLVDAIETHDSIQQDMTDNVELIELGEMEDDKDVVTDAEETLKALAKKAAAKELEALLEELLAEGDADFWLERCDKAGVPAGPINDFDQAMRDEHYLAREMVQEMEHPTIGRMKTVGFPSKFSRTPSQIRSPAPLFAQHTDEVLSQLGLSAGDIDRLRVEGHIK